jgi:putative ABC transport system ATP-binding protein
LHLVAGLDDADQGEIFVDGVDVTRLSDQGRAVLRRGALAIVFQQFNLIPSLTIRANVAFQARLAGRYDAVWLEELIHRLGLENLLERYPEQLSGGQQQRVAIGRALALRPRLLLADEPTGNLDEATAEDFMQLALDVVAATGCAFLMVTHSERLAAKLERRVRLSAGAIEKP